VVLVGGFVESIGGGLAASTEIKRATVHAPEEHWIQEARFFYERADYGRALELFQKAAQQFRAKGQANEFVECSVFSLRILAEREQFEQLQPLRAELQELLLKTNLDKSSASRAHYAIGVSLSFDLETAEGAVNNFRQAIEFALAAGDKSALPYPIYGIVNHLYAQEKYEEALKELKTLDVLLSVQEIPDLACGSLLLKGLIKRNLGQFHALYALGSTYLRLGDKHLAKLYLDLALKSVREHECPRMSRSIRKALVACKTENAEAKYDLTYDPKTGVLISADQRKVRLESQFILRDLLEMFLKKPGEVLTKEQIARKIWNEGYDPAIHDNKIYVTIKRLRKLIEAREGSVELVLRAKDGYFFNERVRVLVL
jgi:DNA-binding winged helix-turn-helix (wHTH) protein